MTILIFFSQKVYKILVSLKKFVSKYLENEKLLFNRY